MPGLLSGIGGIICAALATAEVYGEALGDQFPARADGTVTAMEQAGRQAAGLAVSVAIAIVGGLLTGLFLRLPIWAQPLADQVFDDSSYWTVPEDGFPFAVISENGHHGDDTELEVGKRHEKQPINA
jgi:ammonium transporter Rh